MRRSSSYLTQNYDACETSIKRAFPPPLRKGHWPEKACMVITGYIYQIFQKKGGDDKRAGGHLCNKIHVRQLKWNAEGGYMCPDDISPSKIIQS